MAIRVDDVPPRRSKGAHARQPYVWVDRLAPARREPGVWFRVEGDWSESVAGQIRQGRLHGIERGQYETRRRRQPNGRYHVYVRYVGGTGHWGEPGDEAYRGLPCDGWRVGRGGVVEYHTKDLMRYGGGRWWAPWERAWERQDAPAPPEPSRDELPPGDEHPSSAF